ncbi:MAG TPA: flagellar biosynthesis anti-sigma factor FlgM [Candidatus Eisenbacteria bacterium]|nr:flagellar biosynthesis anti-sigma factor FlgM [Candidatus Eisenbacteria bacterium]
MRINPYFGTQQTPETGRDKQTSQANNSSARVEPQADQAQLSGAHIQVQALAAQASQLPEVREAKINALREAVQSGQYRLDAANTAQGMMSEMFLSRTA